MALLYQRVSGFDCVVGSRKEWIEAILERGKVGSFFTDMWNLVDILAHEILRKERNLHE